MIHVSTKFPRIISNKCQTRGNKVENNVKFALNRFGENVISNAMWTNPYLMNKTRKSVTLNTLQRLESIGK